VSALSDPDGVVALVAAQVEQDPARRQRDELVRHYLGDTTPGAATQRFLDAARR